jgi:hypothetical protein
MLGMIEGSLPDFTKSFEAFAADLKKQAESKASSASEIQRSVASSPVTTASPLFHDVKP